MTKRQYNQPFALIKAYLLLVTNCREAMGIEHLAALLANTPVSLWKWIVTHAQCKPSIDVCM